ncbi:thermonuclease family protein [Pleomorphomonas oryzae]|uniref:thermonuclease family protein n=1 Tax=Pleomorphomonas oryzae TaxID=261934 RepID=UPI00047A0041|nr:thermonuclease family protein [Pleomorphomonas oryzae]
MLRIFAIAATLTIASLAHAANIIGAAIPVDGDTIDIHGTRVRLDGVDAPESRQTCWDATGRTYRCGQVSANALDKFLSASQPIKCRPTGRSYERVVAICQRADGTEVNRWLVANGYAIDWPKYSRGRYAGDQNRARAGRLGVWAGRFEMPCAFRGRAC